MSLFGSCMVRRDLVIWWMLGLSFIRSSCGMWISRGGAIYVYEFDGCGCEEGFGNFGFSWDLWGLVCWLSL